MNTDSRARNWDCSFIENKQVSCFGRFSLNHYLSRFLCGDVALRECRSVSRVQLELARLGIDKSNTLANDLNQTLAQYQQAKDVMLQANVMSLNVLCSVHRLLMPKHEKAGAIRDKQNWLGESREKAVYIPPKADEAKALINEWVQDFNGTDFSNVKTAIESY
ncbi:Fic family protein, partial [Alteromonadaceae bacterium M269]